MLPSADKLYGDADFIFQQDLAPAHTAKGTKSWFNDHGVTVLDWPANSPDLNPIENLWGIVKRKMRDTRPNNADELKATVKETWASIPPQQCHKLITSQFELNYWNKLTFPRHSNLLRCTCIYMYAYMYVCTSVVFWNEEAKFLLIKCKFMSHIISLLRHCFLSRDFPPFILNYPPPNSLHALVGLLKLNGLRGGKRDADSHCNFTCWCRCCTILMLYSISYEKRIIYTLFNVIFCNICLVLLLYCCTLFSHFEEALPTLPLCVLRGNAPWCTCN